jgi:DNA-binding protein H-NS
MSEYQDIQAKIAELQSQAAAIRANERIAAIKDIKSLMATFDISISDLAPETTHPKRKRGGKLMARSQKVEPKYRDGAGNQWSGRGLQPRWLRTAIAGGASLESFVISRPS